MTKAQDSIGCTNVPLEWAMEPHDTRLIKVGLKMDAMAELVLGMRSRHARHAYVTSGLDKHGMLVDEDQFRRTAWSARPEWKSVLKRISEEHGENDDLVDLFAQSLFVKRARGFNKVLVWSNADNLGIWTDVRASAGEMRPFPGACDPEALDRGFGVCAHCQTGPVRQRCGTCRAVFYCDHSCQLADWKRHKKICNKKPAVPAGTVH